MSNEALRFYIATDGTAMQKAEMALVYSIQKVCSVPFSVHFMDKHRPNPLWHGWNDKKWYTPFSNFRFAIPEVNGFQGRAVYMDVDQIILKDPKELFELEIPEDKAWLALDPSRTDVMLMDCAKFKNIAKRQTYRSLRSKDQRLLVAVAKKVVL